MDKSSIIPLLTKLLFGELLVPADFGWSICCLLTGIVLLIIFRYWSWSRSRFVRLINALPGPKALPFLGNALDLNVDHDGYLLIYLKILNLINYIFFFQIEFLKIFNFDWIQNYGKIYRVWLGERPIVVISAPELMEPILCSNKFSTKAVEYSYLSSFLGNCTFLATGYFSSAS